MKTKCFTLLIGAAALLLSASTRQNVSQLYFIRSTNEVGDLIAYKVFIDDKLVCNLKNQHYSVHGISPGMHTVAIQNTGLSSHKKSPPLSINVLANQSNYLIAVNGKELYLQEVVETSAKALLTKVAVTQTCLTAAKNK